MKHYMRRKGYNWENRKFFLACKIVSNAIGDVRKSFVVVRWVKIFTKGCNFPRVKQWKKNNVICMYVCCIDMCIINLIQC